MRRRAWGRCFRSAGAPAARSEDLLFLCSIGLTPTARGLLSPLDRSAIPSASNERRGQIPRGRMPVPCKDVVPVHRPPTANVMSWAALRSRPDSCQPPWCLISTHN